MADDKKDTGAKGAKDKGGAAKGCCPGEEGVAGEGQGR